MLEEEYFNSDGTSTIVRRDPDGWESYENTDIYGYTTVERYNPETGENEYSYEDDWGNWVTEKWAYDETTEEHTMTREVVDEMGQVFIE
jgi:hypothetical protein